MDELTARHGQRMQVVVDDATDALRARWTTSEAGLLQVVPEVIEGYGELAAVVGADYYDAFRDAAGVSGAFLAEPVAPAPTASAQALVRWGLATGADDEAVRVLIEGGLQRRVRWHDRQTVRDAVRADDQARGWRRATKADGCTFCRMLAGRGAVYRKDTARFGAHDHCGCSAEPAFTDGPPASALQYAATSRSITDSDRARVREHLAGMAEQTTPAGG